MGNVEKLSNFIASKISANLSIDSEREEVLAYGAFALIQTILSIIIIVIFGVIFDVLIEVLVISFSAAILRKFSGGVHATSPIRCALIGMFIFGVLAFLVKHFIINLDFIYLIVIMMIAFAFVLYIMFKYSPVGSVNKPLKNEKTRKNLKIKSIKFVLYLLILNIILITTYFKTKNSFLLTISLCISTGVVWQSITMVSLGHLIINILDKLLGGTN
ncbi:MAG: accessory gene regulator B family protein [Tissierellia bacterium]|nr:accessory gene regulator B family protein [Tissierellia bacterium]